MAMAHILRMVGRVVEVKFVVNPRQVEAKAIAQVRTSQEILQQYLSGDPTRRDALFRSKQLSLLLKSRLEQLQLMESDESPESLDINRLSAQLAAGKYRVDYTCGYEGRHILGDVFLLHTSRDGSAGQAPVRVENGVRIVELTKSTLNWLAFQEEDAGTMPGAPTDTLPDLGRYAGSAMAEYAGEPPPSPPSPPIEEWVAPPVEPASEPPPVEEPVVQAVAPATEPPWVGEPSVVAGELSAASFAQAHGDSRSAEPTGPPDKANPASARPRLSKSPLSLANRSSVSPPRGVVSISSLSAAGGGWGSDAAAERDTMGITCTWMRARCPRPSTAPGRYRRVRSRRCCCAAARRAAARASAQRRPERHPNT
jgi:hypothetical protein